MNGKRFINHVAHLFRGQVLYAFSQWLVLALLSAFGGAGQSGDYVLILATTSPIFMLFDLLLRVTRATDHQYGEQFRTYLVLRSICLCFAVLISIGLVWYLDGGLMGLLAGLLLFRVGDSFSNLSFGGYQRVNAADEIGRSLTAKGIVTLIAIAVVIPLTKDAIWAAATMGLISIYWGLFRDLPGAWSRNESELPLRWSTLWNETDFQAVLRVTKRSLPLGFDSFVSSLSLNMPRYCIEYSFGRDALGVFGVIQQLAFAVQMLIGAVGHTGVSVLAERRKRGDSTGFWRLFNRMIATSAGLGVLAIVGGGSVLPWLLPMALGEAYLDQFWLILTLLAASCLAGMQRMAGRGIQASGSYFIYTAMDCLLFVGTTIAALTLVPKMGSVGGALALVIGFIVSIVATFIYVYWRLWPKGSESSES